MNERDATLDDVRHALINSFSCDPRDRRDTWQVTGTDTTGDALSLIVVVVDGVVVITVYG